MNITARRLLFAIVLLGVAVRLLGITMPLVESHQIRQVQTAMMARNLFEDHLNIFRTRLDFFGNVPGYIIMEFPLMHACTALFYFVFGVHEQLGRLVSVIFSCGAMAYFFAAARFFLPVPGALAALALYAFSPLNVFFSRAFMPESSMMFFSIAALYYLLRWGRDRSPGLFAAAIAMMAFACLVKPTAAIMLAPACAFWWSWYGRSVTRRPLFWLYLGLSLLPALAWGVYANRFNAGRAYIPAGFGGNWIELVLSRGIVEHWLSPAFYKFVGGSLILLFFTPLGFAGVCLGIAVALRDKTMRPLYVWLAAMVLYFYGLSGINQGHVYYHYPVLPVGALFFGYGFSWLSNRGLKFSRLTLGWAAVLFVIVLAYTLGYYKYFVYMYDTRLRMPYVLEVAAVIREKTPAKRFIIENQPGAPSTVLPYYAHARSQFFRVSGTAVQEIEAFRKQGATAYVAIDSKYGSGVKDTRSDNVFWEYLNRHYRPIALTDHYLIFDLTTQR